MYGATPARWSGMCSAPLPGRRERASRYPRPASPASAGGAQEAVRGRNAGGSGTIGAPADRRAQLGPAFAERASRYDREASFPHENYAELREAGFLGLCIPARYGGLGASFADYMHTAAELARFCPMTALTFNMHCQTMLWTGLVADDLDFAESDRDGHERVRAALYRGVLEDGHIHSQPLSEGVSRGATAGVTTKAEPTDGGWRVSGAQDLRLAGRRRRLLQPDLRGARRDVGALPLGPQRHAGRAHRRRVGSARHARHGLAHAAVRGRVRAAGRRAAADRRLRPAQRALAVRLHDADADLRRA